MCRLLSNQSKSRLRSPCLYWVAKFIFTCVYSIGQGVIRSSRVEIGIECPPGASTFVVNADGDFAVDAAESVQYLFQDFECKLNSVNDSSS